MSGTGDFTNLCTTNALYHSVPSRTLTAMRWIVLVLALTLGVAWNLAPVRSADSQLNFAAAVLSSSQEAVADYDFATAPGGSVGMVVPSGCPQIAHGLSSAHCVPGGLVDGSPNITNARRALTLRSEGAGRLTAEPTSPLIRPPILLS